MSETQKQESKDSQAQAPLSDKAVESIGLIVDEALKSQADGALEVGEKVEIQVIKETEEVKKAVLEAAARSGREVVYEGNAVFTTDGSIELDEETKMNLFRSDAGIHGNATMKIFTNPEDLLEYLNNYGK